MEKIRFDECICKSKLESHDEIKDDLLNDIKFDIGEEISDPLEIKDVKSGSDDCISKLDFYKGTDFNRLWVKKFLPRFSNSVQELIRSLGYCAINVTNVWYQQYLEGDRHGWHIHGEHYTGVYYLEYPKGCARTQICSPYDLKGKYIDVEEGDFIIFPSHWIHRSLPNSKKRKTIISYNFSIISDASKVPEELLTDRFPIDVDLIGE